MRIRRVECSIAASTYSRAPVKVTVSKKSQASSASAWERRKPAQVAVVRSGDGVDPRLLQDLPHGGGGNLDLEDEEFAVDAAVPPGRVLPSQAQHQPADGADGTGPARALRA